MLGVYGEEGLFLYSLLGQNTKFVTVGRTFGRPCVAASMITLMSTNAVAILVTTVTVIMTMILFSVLISVTIALICFLSVVTVSVSIAIIALL